MGLSALTVYFIVMLDNIKHLIDGVCLLSTIMFVGTGFVYFISFGELHKEIRRMLAKVCKISLFVLIPFAIISTILPNSKQAAAIIVIPQLTTKENINTISGEAKEVYGLFKEWVKEKATK